MSALEANIFVNRVDKPLKGYSLSTTNVQAYLQDSLDNQKYAKALQGERLKLMGRKHDQLGKLM